MRAWLGVVSAHPVKRIRLNASFNLSTSRMCQRCKVAGQDAVNRLGDRKRLDLVGVLRRPGPHRPLAGHERGVHTGVEQVIPSGSERRRALSRSGDEVGEVLAGEPGCVGDDQPDPQS